MILNFLRTSFNSFIERKIFTKKITKIDYSFIVVNQNSIFIVPFNV